VKMRKLIIDGVEWFENKFGVRFRYGEEDD